MNKIKRNKTQCHPFTTLLYKFYGLIQVILQFRLNVLFEGEEVGGECVTEVSVDKRDFNKKYKKLLLTLIQEQ